jgi:hypothetical protein
MASLQLLVTPTVQLPHELELFDRNCSSDAVCQMLMSGSPVHSLLMLYIIH